MHRVPLALVAAYALTPPALEAQQGASGPPGRYFVGSSAFVAANLV